MNGLFPSDVVNDTMAKFKTHQVCGQVLSSLTTQELKDMKIDLIGGRVFLQKEIEYLIEHGIKE